MAKANGVKANLVDATSEMLAKKLPSLLNREPLWREVAIKKTNSNIFRHTGVQANIVYDKIYDSNIGYYRNQKHFQEELNYLEKRHSD